MTEVKICGLKTKDAVSQAVRCGASYIGFVFFAKSPRNISPEDTAKLLKNIPQNVKTVAVCVDPSDAELANIFAHFKPDYLQCHGEESIERIVEIKQKYDVKVIKAVAVRSSDDVAHGKNYSDVADMLLFDAKVPKSPLPGGNGLAFDWNLLKNHEFTLPWFLSGGINSDNVTQALKTTGAKLVDVSSSVEKSPGVKDLELIKNFLSVVL